jgi:hypothetical protein
LPRCWSLLFVEAAADRVMFCSRCHLTWESSAAASCRLDKCARCVIGADNAVVSYAAWKAPCVGSLVAATCTIAVPHAKVLLSCRVFLGMVSLALLHALFCLFCRCSCIMHMQPAAVLLLVGVVVCQQTVVFVHASVLRTAVGRVCCCRLPGCVCSKVWMCGVCVWKASYAAAACSRTYAEICMAIAPAQHVSWSCLLAAPLRTALGTVAEHHQCCCGCLSGQLSCALGRGLGLDMVCCGDNQPGHRCTFLQLQVVLGVFGLPSTVRPTLFWYCYLASMQDWPLGELRLCGCGVLQ